MNEFYTYRITWAFVPTSRNDTCVTYVEAGSAADAEILLRDKAERTYKRIIGIYLCEAVQERTLPPGRVLL